MSFEVNTYNPSDVYLTLAGVNMIGWNDVTIVRASESFKFIKGIRGKHTRVRELDSSALVTIALMQTSPSNDILSEILSQDEVSGTGLLEITLADKSGNSLMSSSEAYLVGFPSKSFKDSIEFITWTIQCQSTDDYIIGSNTKPNTQLINKAIEYLNSLST